MAIYKPTNCSPYFSSVDVEAVESLPYYFYCQIDSSNLQVDLKVNGYAITIYDENNAQVFPTDQSLSPVDHISLIDDLRFEDIDEEDFVNLNTGINGTYLKIPVIVRFRNDRFTNTVVANQILASENILQNGHAYKWKITLFQGVQRGLVGEPVVPTDVKYYDMVITTGQIMGSCKDRIQAQLSDNIQANYFIQPVRFTPDTSATNQVAEDAEGYISVSSSLTPTPVGKRVLISSYDYSYGNIYPVIGVEGLTEGQIGNGYWNQGNADAFCIYKLSNDPDIVSVSNKVSRYVGSIENRVVPIANAGISSYTPPTFTNLISAPGNSYFQQIIYCSEEEYQRYKTSNGYLFNFNANLDNSFSDIEYLVSKGDRVLLGQMRSNSTPSEANTPSEYSAYNGIYTLTDVSSFVSGFPKYAYATKYGLGEITDVAGTLYYRIAQPFVNGKAPSYEPSIWQPYTGEYTGYFVMTWTRTSDANTWGSLITKSVLNTANLLTYQFARYDTETQKIILDNTQAGTINTTEVKVFPELPLLIYPNASQAEDIQPFSLDFYRTRYGKILYNESYRLFISPFATIAKGMLWQNNQHPESYFIIDDINAKTWSIKSTVQTFEPDKFPIGEKYQIKTFFRSGDEQIFYCYNTPTLTWFFNDVEEAGHVIAWHDRSVDIRVSYNQKQLVPWRNYKFTLLSSEGYEIDSTETIYNGEIVYRVFGFVNHNSYQIALTFETQTGETYTEVKTLTIDFETSPVEIGREMSVDCKTNSVIFNLGTAGDVLPTSSSVINGRTVETFYSMTDDPNMTAPPMSGVVYDSSVGQMTIEPTVALNGIEYKYTFPYPKAANSSTAIQLKAAQEDFSGNNKPLHLQSRHQLIGDNYQGSVLSYELQGTGSGHSGHYLTFDIYVPDEYIGISGEYQINPLRNTLLYDYYTNDSSIGADDPTISAGPTPVTIYKNSGIDTTGTITTKRFTLPIWMPYDFDASIYDKYNYANVVSCVLYGDHDYSSEYFNILGPYNVYQPNNVTSAIPTIEFPLQPIEAGVDTSISFIDADGDPFVLSDGENLQLFSQKAILYTEYVAEVKDVVETITDPNGIEDNFVVNTHRKKNVLNRNLPIKWQDDGYIWRDGDSIEDASKDTGESLAQHKSLLQQQQEIDEVWRDRAELNGKIYNFDVLTAFDLSDAAETESQISAVKTFAREE